MDTVDTNKERVNLKTTLETRQKYRLIAAYTGESIMDILDRLANEELKHIERSKTKPKKKQS